MTEYAAFLRGINISGKNRIPMTELKKMFVSLGFTEVSTVLNSGNVLFSSDDKDTGKLRSMIEDKIRDEFKAEIPVCVTETEHLKDILNHAPEWWGTDDKNKYNNLVFILTDDTPEHICKEIGEPSEGMEQITVYDDIVFWSFDLTCYQKCRWWKRTAEKGIAEKLTIRTSGTVRKVCLKKGK